MMISPVGSPARGEQFFDRESEQRRFWRRLQHDNILLLAPRRVGKTSLMLKLQEHAPGHGYQALYFTVEGAQNEGEFVQRLYEKLREFGTLPQRLQQHPGDWLKQLKRHFKKLPGVEFATEADNDWRVQGETILAALNKDVQPLLLLIDEVPVFILRLLDQDSTGRRARDFLDWLRRLRQTVPSLRWLLAGSIGLDTVTARLNCGDTINDLALESLGAFPAAVADQFLLTLAQAAKLVLPADLRQAMIERIEWLIPFHLCLFFDVLHEESEECGHPPDSAMLETVFQKLLSTAQRSRFDYWRQRLHEQLGKPDGGWAVQLLSSIAREARGLTVEPLRQELGRQIHEPDERDSKLSYLLNVLENDGYLVRVDTPPADGPNEARFRFRSALLRAYWLKWVTL